MIVTQNLIFSYPNGLSLTFPDVEMAQGQVLLLTGPSGCGKSTWLALVAGLVSATQGQVTVAEQDLNQISPRLKDAWRAATIGFLPQKLHLTASLTVEKNLELAQWASGRPVDRSAIGQALAALDLTDLAGRMPLQLSGGQAQKVALARAMLLNPKVVLADEPTSSLDDNAAAGAVGLLLTATRQRRATLVVATHDARVAAIIKAHGEGPSLKRLQLSGHSA
jgi:putative ABC transport system ATP-binding protein